MIVSVCIGGSDTAIMRTEIQESMSSRCSLVVLVCIGKSDTAT